jgi:hypothetical protein
MLFEGRGRKGFAGCEVGSLSNVPFEFEGEVASAGAMAEASDVESGTTARTHACGCDGGGCVVAGNFKRPLKFEQQQQEIGDRALSRRRLAGSCHHVMRPAGDQITPED